MKSFDCVQIGSSISMNKERALQMRDITLWCPQCELWTKKYTRSGFHDCGTEVISVGNGDQTDLNYEGEELQ